MLATHEDLLSKFDQLETKLADHDNKIMLILEYLKQFEEEKQQQTKQATRKHIGYKSKD
jgi:hypothetical protein